MNVKTITTVAVSVVMSLVLAFFVLGVGKGTGAAAGPTLYENIQFLNGFTKNGPRVATTTTAADTAVTMTTQLLDKDVSYISYNPGANTTLTTMASTAAPFSNLAVGETLEVLFYNATSSTGTTITFAAGTGVDLQEDEGETVVVNGLEVARLTFVKKANTDVIAWVEVGQVGD